MVNHMRHTRSQTRQRRSHHALGKVAIADDNGTMHRRHTMNPVTGMYRGKQIVDMNKRAEKKAKKAKSGR